MRFYHLSHFCLRIWEATEAVALLLWPFLTFKLLLEHLSTLHISVAFTFRRHLVHTLQDLYCICFLLSHVINLQIK